MSTTIKFQSIAKLTKEFTTLGQMSGGIINSELLNEYSMDGDQGVEIVAKFNCLFALNNFLRESYKVDESLVLTYMG